jgi:hypothetical protein
MTLISRPPLGQKTKAKKDAKRLAAVAAMPCVICHEYGLPQRSQTQVHHCIHGRHSQRRAPDSMTLPLCEGHHTGLMDTTKIALHREPLKWQTLYGQDVDWLNWVEARMEEGL